MSFTESPSCVTACGLDADCAAACSASLPGKTKANYDAAFTECARASCKDECFFKKELGDTCSQDSDCLSARCIYDIRVPRAAVGFCTTECTDHQDCVAGADKISDRFGQLLFCFEGIYCYPGCSTADDCKQYSNMTSYPNRSPRVCTAL